MEKLNTHSCLNKYSFTVLKCATTIPFWTQLADLFSSESSSHIFLIYERLVAFSKISRRTDLCDCEQTTVCMGLKVTAVTFSPCRNFKPRCLCR